MSDSMYKTGEIESVMQSFEKALKDSSLYVSGTTERAERVEVEMPNGLLLRRYKNNNYYNNGQINKLFIAFLHGYANGKCVGLQIAT